MWESMRRADKTINTKVGLDLPMSEQVRQRQVTLDEGKNLVNTKGGVRFQVWKRDAFPVFCGYRCYQGSNFHVWNRLVSIVGGNCTTMLTEPCP